jgi:uncharacterized C2H2 Zn-finger protein
MFFIGIFGIEEKDAELRVFTNIVCPACGRLSSAALILHYTYFHFFFIPTFRWNRRYFLKLRCCGAVYEAPEDYAKELKAGGTVDFSRLKKVSGGFGGDYGDFYARCPSCGRTFDKSYSFCPYCGTKI